MRTSHAVLLLAAVGVAHIAQKHVHQRQWAEAVVTRLHHDWLTNLSDHPDLAVQWGLDGMDKEEMVRVLSANQQVSALGLRYRLGLGPRLDFIADAFMGTKIGQDYWDKCGPFRTAEAAGNKPAEEFCRALEKARRAYPKAEPVGV